MKKINGGVEYGNLFGGVDQSTVKTSERVDFSTLAGGYNLREAVGRLADRRVLTVGDVGFVGHRLGLSFDQKWAKGRLGSSVTAVVNGENLDAALMVDTTYDNNRPAREITLGASASSLKLVRTEGGEVAVSWWDKMSDKRRGTMVDAVGRHSEISAELSNILSTRGYLTGGAFRALMDGVQIEGLDGGAVALIGGTETVKLLVEAGRIVEEMDRKAGAIEAVKRLVAYRPRPLEGPEGVLGKYGSRFDTLDNNPRDVILALWLLDQDSGKFVEAGGMDFAYVLGMNLGSVETGLGMMAYEESLPAEDRRPIPEGYRNPLLTFFAMGGEVARAKVKELVGKINELNPPESVAYKKQ